MRALLQIKKLLITADIDKELVISWKVKKITSTMWAVIRPAIRCSPTVIIIYIFIIIIIFINSLFYALSF